MKTTQMEYIRKIGMIVRPCLKLASNLIHAQAISNKIQLENSLIEFKKEFTFERDIQLKIIIIYTVETKANDIDEKLVNINHPSIQYISFKRYTVLERIGAIYINEIINVKVWFEMLSNVEMNKVVKYNDK